MKSIKILYPKLQLICIHESQKLVSVGDYVRIICNAVQCSVDHILLLENQM